MTFPERFLIGYSAMATASFVWAVWRVSRSKSVRSAVEGLPVSVTPLWAVVVWTAYAAGGALLALQVAGIGLIALAGLWLLRFGVATDSLPQDVVPESALQEAKVPLEAFGAWRLPVLGVMFVLVIVWIALALRG